MIRCLKPSQTSLQHDVNNLGTNFCLLVMYYRPSDRVRKKTLCGNFRQYYAAESDDYAEKTSDVEISKINKVVPLVISNV